ncbi:unnamed protein product [Ilex paraguariensis]|uniref:DELLA protein n=1 Tax=Ilex paraguariensis TaxID=185542 RepID=A0ABC8SC47_9AQUA
MGEAMKDHHLESVRSVVFKESETLEGSCSKIEGYDFNKGVNYSELLKSMVSTGFQASNLGDAIEVVNQMIGGYQMSLWRRIAAKGKETHHTEDP